MNKAKLKSWYKKRKRRLWLIGSILILVLTMNFFWRRHVPDLEKWAVLKLESISRENGPARIWPQKANIALFPPAIIFQDIRLLPKEELRKQISPFIIKQIEARLSLWGLIKGQLGLSILKLDNAHLNVFANLKPKQDSETNFKINLPINEIASIPIDKVELKNIGLRIIDGPNQMALSVAKINFALTKLRKSAEIEILAHRILWKQPGELPTLAFDADIRGAVDADGIYLSRFRLQKGDSFILAAGVIEGDPLSLSIRKITGQARASLELTSLSEWAGNAFPKYKIPKMDGQVALNLRVDQKLDELFSSEFNLNSKSVYISGFEVGNLDAKGIFQPDLIKINQAHLKHSGGQAEIKSAELNLQKNIPFSAKIIGEHIDIHKLLKGLKINRVPVFTDLNADLNCEGNILPNPLVKCDGVAVSEKIDVRSSVNSPNSIVDVHNISASGTVLVTNKDVSYQTNLKLGHDTGTSSGIINYKTGFKIDYNTDHLDLKNMGQIASIPVEGFAKLKGSTEGGSNAATFYIDAIGDQIWVDDFGLGDVTLKLKYKNGILNFSPIEGRYRASQYKGNFSINLTEDRLFAEIDSNFLDIEEIQELFDRRVPLPIKIDGNGSAHLSLRSPFDMKKASFDFTANLTRGIIAKESYDQARIDLSAIDGLIQINRFSLTKGSGIVIGEGNWNLNKDMNLNIKGRNLRMEQSEHINDLKLNIAGALNVDAHLQGNLDNPQVNLLSEIKNVLVNEEPVANATAKLTLNSEEIALNLELGHKILLVDLIWPFSEKKPYSIDISFDDWDFSQSFSIFTDSLRANNYQANLKGKISLSGIRGKTDLVQGKMNISKMSFETPKASLKNSKALTAEIKNGQVQIEHFELRGGDNYIKITSPLTSKNHLNIRTDGKLDLSLASIFLPFLEDISGRAHIAIQTTGSLLLPESSGSIVIDDGLLRFKNFPHPLENVYSDIILSPGKLSLNSVRGRLAGGSFSALGQISTNKANELPIDIRGQFRDVSLRFPPGVQSRGNGSVAINGNWFPYLLTIRYDVISGQVDQNIGATEQENKQIKASRYLPKFLAEKRFSPIKLDIGVNIRSEIPVKITLPKIEVQTSVTGDLLTKGDPDSPRLTGRIQLGRNGKIQFRNNTFKITSGYVEYKNSPPHDPYLNVSAESRVTAELKSDKGDKSTSASDSIQREYDVNMRVTGLASKPNVSVSSQPALSEAQLISLLTLGFISESDRPSTSQEDSVTNTSYQLGSAFINDQLGLSKGIGKRIGIEFNYESGYDSTEKAAVHTFSVKKQWSPKFGTTASRSVGKINTNNVKAEYRLNNNISVIGSYEGKEQSGASSGGTINEETPNLFGLDVEYRVDFK